MPDDERDESSEDNPHYMTRDELHAKAIEQWGRVADKLTAFGEALGKLGDAVREVTKAVDMVGNEFDALGPVLDELEDESGEGSEATVL